MKMTCPDCAINRYKDGVLQRCDRCNAVGYLEVAPGVVIQELRQLIADMTPRMVEALKANAFDRHLQGKTPHDPSTDEMIRRMNWAKDYLFWD